MPVPAAGVAVGSARVVNLTIKAPEGLNSRTRDEGGRAV